MKNLILFFLLIIPCIGNSQGTLQFNQVLLINSLSTVPAGKVWKVEGFMHTGGAPYALSESTFSLIGFSGNRGFYGIARFSVNSQTVDIPAAISHQANFAVTSPTALSWFPMWLPAGTTLQPVTNVRFFNVIEFNIIP